MRTFPERDLTKTSIFKTDEEVIYSDFKRWGKEKEGSRRTLHPFSFVDWRFDGRRDEQDLAFDEEPSIQIEHPVTSRRKRSYEQSAKNVDQ